MVINLGSELIAACGEPDKPIVKKSIDEVQPPCFLAYQMVSKSILLIKACLIVVENLLYDTEKSSNIYIVAKFSMGFSQQSTWKDRVDRLEDDADCRSVPGWTAGKACSVCWKEVQIK